MATRRARDPAATTKRQPASAEPPLPDLSQYGRLAEYNRKRRFDVTPEPAGKAGTRAPGRPLRFVVQKHRAGHLHYDFRLEHRGVMLSWAVPKGPAPDPGVKRLAMETEPHPLDYNEFEGVIPEGEYGGGTVMIWDEGVWAPVADDRIGTEADVDRQLAKGDLKFVLLGHKLQGSWVLVRTRNRQWLLIKHRDEYVTPDDLTVTRPLSVVSGRTMAEIARAAGASAKQLDEAARTDPAEPSTAAAEPRRRPARRPPAPASRAGEPVTPAAPPRRPRKRARPAG
jgi:bifunctional non-homologous end joining protein LigD